MLNSSNAWRKKLKKLKDNHQDKTSPPKTIGKPDVLLQRVHALQLLRDMQQVLLAGVGRIELLEDVSGYDLILTLLWNGTVSQPEPPRSNSKLRRHIFIGVRGDALYVNGKRVANATEKDLQSALLKAAQKPGYRKDLTEK